MKGNKMTYTTLGNGWLNKNETVDENNNRPVYIGKVSLDRDVLKDDTIAIALWERDGAYSVKISKTESNEE